MKPKVIDMTSSGPVDDQSDGYADFTNNLGSLLSDLTEDHKTLPKRQKIEVLVSKIRYLDPDYPERYNIAKTYTLGHLLRLYEQLNGSPFDFKEHETKRNYKMALHVKEGERRAAWGQYHQYMHTERLIKEERDFEESIRNLSSREKDEKVKERDEKLGKKATLLYIG